MKRISLIIPLLFCTVLSFAWQEKQQTKLYNPEANAREEIKNAVSKAKKEHKNVLLQVGGNWCIWCTRFHQTVAGNDTLNKLLQDNYEIVYVNYEKKKR